MKKTFVYLFGFFCLLSLFQSCKKDETTDPSTAAQAVAEDIVSHNDMTEQVEDEVYEAVPDNFTGDTDDRGGCAIVTYAQPKGTWPNTVTIDFGTGCTKPDGRTLKGKIIINQSNKMSVTGATRVVTFDGFFIENVHIEGSWTLTNTGLNPSAQPTFTRSGAETLHFPDGTTATHQINHIRTLVEGVSTPLVILDNVWSILINDSGVNRKGENYTVKSTNPLLKRAVCPWIGQGTLQFEHAGKTRTLDFGTGECDREATLTLADGTVKEVKIRHRWWK